MSKTYDAETEIGSITLLPNGRIFMATKKRLYELDVHGVWNPMKFAVPVPEPVVATPGTTKPGLFAPAGQQTPAVTS